MKKLLQLFIVATLCFFWNPVARAATYTYYRTITVTSTASVASGTLTNYPMLVSSTLATWETTSTAGGAGRIQNMVNSSSGIQEAADLIFVTSTPVASGANWNCGNPLSFETESWTSSTGALVDWVNVPSMSAGQVIYACYGAAAVNTDQSNSTGTWNSNFKAVYHFATQASSTDSTGKGANLILFNGNAGVNQITTGTIDGAVNYTGAANSFLQDSGFSWTSTNPITWSGWVFKKSADSGTDAGIMNAKIISTKRFNIQIFTDSKLYFDYGDNNGNGRIGLTYTPYFDNWQYITEQSSGGSGGMKVYIGGKVVGTTAVSDHPTGVSGLNVGQDAGTTPMKGNLDEYRIANNTSTFTSQWILTDYNNQIAPDANQTSTGFYAVGAETAGAAGSPAGFSGTARSIMRSSTIMRRTCIFR